MQYSIEYWNINVSLVLLKICNNSLGLFSLDINFVSQKIDENSVFVAPWYTLDRKGFTMIVNLTMFY